MEPPLEFRDRPALPFDGFYVSQTDFDDWLHVWRMDPHPQNVNRGDILGFTQQTMERKAFEVLEKEEKRMVV